MEQDRMTEVTNGNMPRDPLDLSGLSAGDAELFAGQAEAKRAATVNAAPLFRAQQEAEADGLDALASALRDPSARNTPALHVGRGGEIAPADDPDMSWRQRELARTVGASPRLLAADASLARLSLARDADALTMAMELAQDGTAAEKMLAHEISAAHRLAMSLFATANRELHKHHVAASLNPAALLDAQRSALVGARLMAVVSQASLALDRLRNGARQLVTVQHVTVEDGGQAVVAGAVRTQSPAGTEGQ
jgi:hypothetical protein